jgi:hypothetical protein
MKQKHLNIYNAKGEIKVKEKHTYVIYIVKLNNVPSEGCDTSQANDPHKITFEIMELLLLLFYLNFLHNILLIYLDLHVPIFLFFILLGPLCAQLFLAPYLSSQKGRKGYLL